MSRRVLVIEDHQDNRAILRDLLTTVGYDILEAVSGEAGLALAEAQPPDLILMDIDLLGIDDYETTSGDDARAFAAGCDAYIAKPFSPRALLARVREFVP